MKQKSVSYFTFRMTLGALNVVLGSAFYLLMYRFMRQAAAGSAGRKVSGCFFEQRRRCSNSPGFVAPKSWLVNSSCSLVVGTPCCSGRTGRESPTYYVHSLQTRSKAILLITRFGTIGIQFIHAAVFTNP